MRPLRALQVALFLVGETGWLDAWSIGLGWWIDPGRGGLIGLPVLLAVLVGATLLTVAVFRQPGKDRRAALAIGALGVVVALLLGFAVLLGARGSGTWAQVGQLWSSTGLGFRHLGVVSLALLAWWRGIVAGRGRIDLYRVQSAVRGQSVALTALFVLNALVPSGSGAPPASLVGGVLLVIFAGFVGMPFARLLDLRRSERGRAGALGINRHWVLMLLGAVSGLLVVSLGLAAILTFDRIDQLLRPLGAVADLLLLIVLYVIGLPLAFVAQWLVGLIPKRNPAPMRTLPLNQIQRAIQQAQTHAHAGPPDLLTEVAKWSLLAMLVVVIVVFLARAAARYAEREASEEVEEARDFVWSWDEVKAALRAWLLGLLNRRRSPAAPGFAAMAPLAPGVSLDPRALYRELLRLGAGYGRQRAPSETPLEYERALAGVAPLQGTEAEVDTITAVYLQARYGREEPDSDVVEEARRALDRLKEGPTT